MDNTNLRPMAEEPNQTLQSHIFNQKGIFLIALGIVFIVLVVGGAAYYFVTNNGNKNTNKSTTELSSNNGITTNKNSQNALEPNPKIEILATLPSEDPHILYNVLFDPFSHIAVYSIDKDHYTATSSSTIVVNGKSGKTYSGNNHLTISPDGKRVAYVAKQDDKEFVVINEVEGKKYDYIKNLKFSPDGQHVVYAAGEGKYFQPDSPYSGNEWVKTMFIVIDNSEGKKYDGTYVEVNVSQTYEPFFSKDGKKVTYTAIKNKNSVLVVDDKEIAEFYSQHYPHPQFIGDTYDLIYLASENNKNFLVVSGQKKPVHDYISDINDIPYYIGKDASQIAYEATDKDVRTAIINDLTYPIPSGVLQDVAFSNSGKYVAYYTGTWISKDLYVNGKLYGNIQPNGTFMTSSPFFSPNEQVLVYSQYGRNDQNATIQILSVDPLKKITEVLLPSFKAVGLMKFSDDSKYIYFKGWQDRKIVFVTLNVDQLIKGKINTQ